MQACNIEYPTIVFNYMYFGNVARFSFQNIYNITSKHICAYFMYKRLYLQHNEYLSTTDLRSNLKANNWGLYL